MTRGLSLTVGLTALTALSAACARPAARCAECQSTVVVAAVGEPSALVPPLVYETIGRDIGDLVYERLADLTAGRPPADTAAYRPGLATSWERLDSLTWRFHLRPGAHWQDGPPVTAEDVRFSFDAFGDPVLDSPARAYLEGRVRVEAEGPQAVRVRFTETSPEQLYDATFHVRIIPKHIWAGIPRERWASDTSLAHLVGSGPYRVGDWKRGQSLKLLADPRSPRHPRIGRVVWRFASDPDAATNLVLSGEADLLESVGGPQQVRRFAATPSVELRSYPAATYGFLAFRLADSAGLPHPLLGDRRIRRALASSVERQVLARALLGPAARAPSGPMSQLLWIWNDSVRTLGPDAAAAARDLDSAGWRRPGPGEARRRKGRTLRFDILVPATSATRRQAALALQEVWRHLGADVTISVVDFPVFQERLRSGRFDAYIGAYLDEPSPRGLADQWTRAGWSVLNYGHYADPSFDELFKQASRSSNVAAARRLYREALDTLNADAPAVFLYAPANIAAVGRRLRGVEINPYSWLSGLPEWRVEEQEDAELAAGR
ncbi:MAG: ABC transporter substrate-binding protein [Gemmatimonadales bacterium]